jgi:hypothetical protein
MVSSVSCLPLLLALALVACTNASGVVSGNSRNKSDDGDGRRPSEQGEGLVGYLRDPGSVRIERGDGKVKVTAPEGAVERDGVPAEGLLVCLQQISREGLRSYLETGGSYGGRAETLARIETSAGRFELVVAEQSVTPDGFLSVDVTGLCGDGTSPFDPTGSSIVFKEAGGSGAGFGNALVFFPEYESKYAGGGTAAGGTDLEDETGVPADFHCGSGSDGSDTCGSVELKFVRASDDEALDEKVSVVVTPLSGCVDSDCEALTSFDVTPWTPAVPYWFQTGYQYELQLSAPGYDSVTKVVDLRKLEATVAEAVKFTATK